MRLWLHWLYENYMYFSNTYFSGLISGTVVSPEYNRYDDDDDAVIGYSSGVLIDSDQFSCSFSHASQPWKTTTAAMNTNRLMFYSYRNKSKCQFIRCANNNRVIIRERSFESSIEQ